VNKFDRHGKCSKMNFNTNLIFSDNKYKCICILLVKGGDPIVRFLKGRLT